MKHWWGIVSLGSLLLKVEDTGGSDHPNGRIGIQAITLQ